MSGDGFFPEIIGEALSVLMTVCGIRSACKPCVLSKYTWFWRAARSVAKRNGLRMTRDLIYHPDHATAVSRLGYPMDDDDARVVGRLLGYKCPPPRGPGARFTVDLIAYVWISNRNGTGKEIPVQVFAFVCRRNAVSAIVDQCVRDFAAPAARCLAGLTAGNVTVLGFGVHSHRQDWM